MKKSIIIASCMLLAVSCNLLDDDKDNNNNGPEPPVSGSTDVAVSSFTAPDSVELGSTVTLEAQVTNSGDEAVSESFMVILSNETTATDLDTVTVESLAVDAVSDITFEWNTTGTPAGSNTLRVSHNLGDDKADNDFMEATVIVASDDSVSAAVYDISVMEATAPDSAVIGSMVDVSVTLENLSDSAVTGDITLTLTDSAGVELASEIVNGMAVDAQTMVTLSWNTTGLAEGDYTLTVAHDYTDDNAANDSAEVTVYLQAEETTDPEPNVDLAITNVVAPDVVTQGDTAMIDVTVDNLGSDAVTEDVSVILLHHNIQQGSTTLTGGLAAGATSTVTIEWLTQDQTTGAPPHPLDIVIEYEDADSTNNVETVQIQVDPAS